MTAFTVHPDSDYGFIVADASIGAYSFAMVPDGERWAFDDRAAAVAQAKALSGRNIPLRMIETPDRFEAVADTVYGPEW